MKRIQMLVASTVVTAASLAVLAAAPMASQAATVELRMTERGQILVDEAGFTLYMFTADKKHQDHCVTIEVEGRKCSSFWPALEVVGTPTAGTGLKAKSLGTTELPGGGKQVTFKKKPLYTYVGDSMPGQTSYLGAFAFNGYWYGLTATGKMVK
jgi:predicted lipoprotein with Yx(FWY)xxD motif